MTWDKNTYRRSLVDCHIPDWDPVFLSKFDADSYVKSIKKAGQQAVMHYANSHSGQCLWNTRVGVKHKNMGNRDFFKEVEVACIKNNLPMRAYFSAIFDSLSYELNPEWRLISNGKLDDYQKSRYGHCCPNSQGYRDYIRMCMSELLGNYDLVDVFYDMVFWPMICVCPNCQTRFLEEEKHKIPTEINWNDPIWRKFQAARQRWLTDFAFWCRYSVKNIKAVVTVGFNNASHLLPWTTGMSYDFARAGDYLFGDFYGGPSQHAMACKVYHSLRPDRPYEYATFVTESYREHASAKSAEQIEIDVGMALIHNGAMMQIDAFNIDGTLNDKVYERLSKLNSNRHVFETYLGGKLIADIAIYVDKESFYDVEDLYGAGPHHKALMSTACTLQRAHIPFAVVTNENLSELSKYRAIIASSIQEMTKEQAELFRSFVAEGGILISSGTTSLDRCNNKYLLEDVFGVRYLERFPYRLNFFDLDNKEISELLYPQECLTVKLPIQKTELIEDAVCLARVKNCFVDPDAGRMIGQTFASIHSDPPSPETSDNPAIAVNHYGKGTSVWSAAPFETNRHWASRKLLIHLIRKYLPGPYLFEAEAPEFTEITLSKKGGDFVLGLLHTEAMTIPFGVKVKVKIPEGKTPKKVLLLPDKNEIPFEVNDNILVVEVPEFQTVSMLYVGI